MISGSKTGHRAYDGVHLGMPSSFVLVSCVALLPLLLLEVLPHHVLHRWPCCLATPHILATLAS
jgi:hypothetical protein